MTHLAPQKRPRGRPPKNQIGFKTSKDALLRSGMEILTEKGYSAAGLDEILRQVGVPKGSFYHYFNSKEAFGIALIKHYATFFQHKLDKFLTQPDTPPLSRLTAFIDDATKGMERYNFKRGCLIGNLGQEMSALPESFRGELNAVFEAWQLAIETCLNEAKSVGQIAQTIDTKQSAYIFWVGWEGAVLRAKLDRNPNALQAFTQFYLKSLI